MVDSTAEPEEIQAGVSRFYVPATALTSLERPQTLKADDSFLVMDPCGDCGADVICAEGLYHRDTRYLSRLAVKLDGATPLLLSSGVEEDNGCFRADLTNPDIYVNDSLLLPRD